MTVRTLILTLFTMTAFAGNSLLCRMALKHTGIDPASFTAIRIISGALVLWLIVFLKGSSGRKGGSWYSAAALFAYAGGFSFAYVSLNASTGALLLFGAVQATMIGYGLVKGERLNGRQAAGLVCAAGGLIFLLLPGLSAPPIAGSLLMLGAGIAWGIYSLRGKDAGNPVLITSGNFLRAVPFVLILSLILISRFSLDTSGLFYAVVSGAVASGVGYAVWYTVLRELTATTAAVVQLSVPVIAAAGGIAFLSEVLTLRLVISSAAILGGVALVIVEGKNAE